MLYLYDISYYTLKYFTVFSISIMLGDAPKKSKSDNVVNISEYKKKYASTININVILRIFEVLYENGKTKRTNLAGKAGLSYDKCVKYVNLMLLFDWIRSSDDNDGYQISITDKGINLMKVLVNV